MWNKRLTSTVRPEQHPTGQKILQHRGQLLHACNCTETHIFFTYRWDWFLDFPSSWCAQELIRAVIYDWPRTMALWAQPDWPVEEKALGTHGWKTNFKRLSEVKRDRGNEMKGDIRALLSSCADAWLECEAHCLGPKQTWDLPTVLTPLCFVRAWLFLTLTLQRTHSKRDICHGLGFQFSYSTILCLLVSFLLRTPFYDLEINFRGPPWRMSPFLKYKDAQMCFFCCIRFLKWSNEKFIFLPFTFV